MKKLISKESSQTKQISKTMPDIGCLNEHWASLMVKHLISHGVRYFCLAPGNRSTPLTLAVAKHPLTETTVHFDERGLSYHALGYVKGSNVPACIITTSGSAVGNLMPAIMEASLENIPLIILTSDRPPELRDNGSNQSLDQVKLFESYVRWQFDLPCPSPQISDRFISTTIAQAVQRAKFPPMGPVHINCMFREPYFPHKEKRKTVTPTIHQHQRSEQTISIPMQGTPSSDSLDTLAEEFAGIEKGVIIAAGNIADSHCAGALTLSKKLGWPIISDVLSGFRSIGRDRHIIPFHELILKSAKSFDDIQIKAAVQLGDYLISKTLLTWISKQPLDIYAHVANHPKRIDPHHCVTHRIECLPSTFCFEMNKRLSKKGDSAWISLWKDLSQNIEERLVSFFQKRKNLSEQQVIRYLADELDKDTSLFLSNSLPIRDAEALLFPVRKVGLIYGNRGHSGIDGNIATAIGISKGTDKRLIAILGDLSFLHDMNSLALLRSHPHPITFIIMNNFGGGIFSFLPIAQEKEIFEKFFAASHEYEFKFTAQQFNLRYYSPQTIDQFLSAMEKTREKAAHSLIEIRSDREENYREHADLLSYLKQNGIHKELKQCYPHLLKKP